MARGDAGTRIKHISLERPLDKLFLVSVKIAVKARLNSLSAEFFSETNFWLFASSVKRLPSFLVRAYYFLVPKHRTFF
jgi:hypothetical protein